MAASDTSMRVASVGELTWSTAGMVGSDYIGTGAEWPKPARPCWPPRSETGSKGRAKATLP